MSHPITTPLVASSFAGAAAVKCDASDPARGLPDLQ